MSDDRDVIRREVPAPLPWIGVIGFLWVLFAVAAQVEPQLAGARTISLALLPIAGLGLVWAMVSRQVVVASADGIRITRRPWSGPGRWILREDLAAIHIEQVDDQGLVNERGRLELEDPSSAWSVSVVTRGGDEVLLADGLAYGDRAEELVSEVQGVLGPPEVPVNRSQRKVL